MTEQCIQELIDVLDKKDKAIEFLQEENRKMEILLKFADDFIIDNLPIEKIKIWHKKQEEVFSDD